MRHGALARHRLSGAGDRGRSAQRKRTGCAGTTLAVNNNNSLGQILWEQMVLGYPEHGVRYAGPFVDYAAFATANGALGIKVER